MTSVEKKRLLTIGPLEADIIGILGRLKEATANEIWNELNKTGRKTAYTTILTVLSRLYTRGLVSKRQKMVNNARQYVYKLTISDEMKYDLIRQHIYIIGKMFGDEGLNIMAKLLMDYGPSYGYDNIGDEYI
ncbi:MAG: BlaI/MecI/CopY family transcriptional regulator [Thermocladium sp.]|jgi:Predicted transcriptional regulator